MASTVTDKSQSKVRLAGVQCAVNGSRQENIKRIISFARTAVEKGAKLVVFPECFTLPWLHVLPTKTFISLAETVPGPSTQPFIDLSREYLATFVCPIFETDGERRYFSSVVIQSGEILETYRKIHLSASGHWNEPVYAEPGDNLGVIDLGFATVGIVMGWDVFFPEAVSAMALQGAQIIIAPTAAAMASKFRWLSVLSSHAVCNNVFVLRVNRCGTETDVSFYGESFCINPYGELVDEPTFHRDSLMIADIDISDVQLARKEFPFLRQRRPDVYRLSLDSSDRGW